MRVSILPREQSIFLQMIRRQREQEAARTGLHCSTIIYDIAKATFPSQFREGIDEATGLSFQELGNAIEDVVAEGLRRRFPGWSKPPELEYRGVRCNLDGWNPRSATVDEVKVLWKSEVSKADGRFITTSACDVGSPRLESCGFADLVEESGKFIYYKMQLLFYMAAKRHAERRRRDIRGRLHALFINGNYQPPFPDPVSMVLRPTDDELDANEECIIQHAQDRGWLRP